MFRNNLLTLLAFLLWSPAIFAQLEWTMISTPNDETLNDVTFVNEQVAYAVGMNGTILKSSDGGETFVLQNTREGFNLNAVFAIDDQNVWVVGENSLIYRTTDGGTTWTWENTEFPSTLIDVYFMDENKGFLVYDDLDDDDRLKIVTTEDGGMTWDAVNLPQDIDLPTGTVEVTSYQHRTEINFPTPEVGYLCFTQGLLKSEDGGQNWNFQVVESQEDYGLTGSFPVALDFIDAENGIVVSPFQSAIGYTLDGASRLTMTDETHEFGGYDVKYLSADDAYVVGDLDYAIYHLTNNGASVATQFFVSNPEPAIDSTRRFYGVDFWSPELGIAIGGNGRIARFAMTVSSSNKEVNDLPIDIYPNPVQGQLNIRLPQELDASIEHIRFINHLGQPVQVESSLNGSIWQFHTSQLATGMYYLAIQTTEGQTLNRKIIVQN